MWTVIRRMNRDKSRFWSKRTDSPVKDMKLDFCGEKTMWSYPTTSSPLWENTSLQNNACRKMISYKSVITTLLTLTSKLVVSTKSNKSNRTNPETKFNGICHIILSSTLKNPKEVRRVYKAAAKYQSVAIDDKFLSEPDLLQSLITIMFRFREQQIALSADKEAMFLQVAVPSGESQCLWFLWQDDPEQMIEFTSIQAKFLGRRVCRIVLFRFASRGDRR